jgi:uncharacterized Zn-binding protein involved in type VI secretion
MAINQCHRIEDLNTAYAPIISVVQSTVYCNGILVAVDGSPVKPHGLPPHAAPVTANGSQTVFINGTPVNRTGDPDSCGHPRMNPGSPNTYVG